MVRYVFFALSLSLFHRFIFMVCTFQKLKYMRLAFFVAFILSSSFFIVICFLVVTIFVYFFSSFFCCCFLFTREQLFIRCLFASSLAATAEQKIWIFSVYENFFHPILFLCLINYAFGDGTLFCINFSVFLFFLHFLDNFFLKNINRS